MIIKTGELGKRIKENEDNLFLIYGEEDFFIERAVNSIKHKYLASGFETMDYIKLDFNGKSVVVDTVVENIELPPWASSKRIVEVVNFDFDKEAAEKITDVLGNIPDSTLLMFVTSKFDKRKKKLFDAFTKQGVVCEVTYLEGGMLTKYITQTFGKSGITIDADACDSMISRFNSSMRRIDSAVKRIAVYCESESISNVNMALVDELCEPDVYGDIFKIMDAVGMGDASLALILLDNLIKMKEPLPRIRFMIARHFREMICAKELGNKNAVMNRLGSRSFVADKLIRQSRNFTMNKLLQLYKLCYKNDYDLKHGEADERASLESFIVLASGK